MIRDIPMPKISPNFTIDDIHKIREWNYERMKDATPEERRLDSERAIREFNENMDRIRKEVV